MNVAGTLSLAERILAAVKALLGMRDELEKAALARRARIADLFERVDQ